MISYDIGKSGQRLILADAVLGHFDRNRQRRPKSREAGGQLFARFEGDTIRMEQATGPRASDRRSSMTFIPDRLVERREIKRFFRLGLHYVGDWHTHPEHYPSPSQTDLNSVQDMFRKSHHRLASFVMIVVGTETPPEGLFVALCSATECHELKLLEDPRPRADEDPKEISF